MDRPGATRTELLARRAQTALAVRGKAILEEKRDQLIAALREAASAALARADELDRAASLARRALALAEALEGPEALRSAALAAGGEVEVDARTVSLMGVRVPEIARHPLAREAALRGAGPLARRPRIEAAAERFEEELSVLLDVAVSELRVRRLAAEVGRTTRRVNAIEEVVIPRLRAETRMIREALEEREREDRFRLRRAKAGIARRAGASGGGAP
jgi:V/A-type H+-transporting ATPase subunit D